MGLDLFDPATVNGLSAFAAGSTLTASLYGAKAVGDLFNGAATPGPVRALALSQFTTSALSLATLSADKETKRRVQGAIAVSSFATAALAQVDKKKSVAGSLKAGEANFVTGVALVQGVMAAAAFFKGDGATKAAAPVAVKGKAAPVKKAAPAPVKKAAPAPAKPAAKPAAPKKAEPAKAAPKKAEPAKKAAPAKAAPKAAPKPAAKKVEAKKGDDKKKK